MAYTKSDQSKNSTIKRINKILEDLKFELKLASSNQNPKNIDYQVDQKMENLQNVISTLERVKSGKEDPKIKPLTLYLDIIDLLREQAVLKSDFFSLLHNAENIYDNLFQYGVETPEFENTVEIYKVMIGENGLVLRGFYDPFLFSSFCDKHYYLTLIQVISNQKNAQRLFEAIKGHALEARQYLVEDVGYLTYLLRVVSKLCKTSTDAYGAVLSEELLKIERSNGVYDIDPVRLAQVEKNVQNAALTIESGKNILQSMEIKNRDMERILQEMNEKANDTIKSTQTYLDTKVQNAKSTLDETLKHYEETQKKSIQLEKELFLKQVFTDAEVEINRYRVMAKSITSTTAAEIASLGRDADAIVTRLRNASSNDAKLQEFAKKTEQNQELLNKIEKLTILNDSMIERFGKEFSKMPADPKENPDDVQEKSSKEAAPHPMDERRAYHPDDREIPPMPPRQRPGKNGERPIPAANPLLDRTIPFQKRFSIVMKEKQRRMAQGELYHEMFDDVITAVLEDVNPYLIGPSGCGKTYMVKQIGELLNVDLSDIGYINEEYDILGYVTAMGEYSESNFYWLYKYGGIAFCDELDNGNSKATVKLNSFLSNHIKANYCFPGGERVEKHPNFRMIAAGNTDGTGADVNYSTREKIEESVLQRMIPIYIGYDNRVEQEILKKYPDWFEFACAFRTATDHWSDACGMPAQGIFTTRDAYRVKQYLDNGSFTPLKIITYEFIQTKEPEYLGFLKEEIAKIMKKDSSAYKNIYQLFADEVDRIRKKGKNLR